MTVGHASYSYGFNGFVVPADQPWLANQIDPDRIMEDARRLQRVGADFVVVSLHWGAEYNVHPISFQTNLARQLAGSGDIGLDVGHHAHVVQPLAVMDGTPVGLWAGELSLQSDRPAEPGRGDAGRGVGPPG